MVKKTHIAAVIQARMRSTRLPGKVLKEIVGQPLLWHIIHRLRKSELIQTICVQLRASRVMTRAAMELKGRADLSSRRRRSLLFSSEASLY